MMLQIDGSPHDWLEGRGPYLCLIGGIDDATSKVPAAFFEEQETSWAYFRLFLEVGKKQGLALSAYTDRRPSPYRSYAGKKVQVHVLLDGSVELFYKNEKIARCDSKTTHTIGLYRTNGRRKVSSYGPETTHPVLPYELPP